MQVAPQRKRHLNQDLQLVKELPHKTSERRASLVCTRSKQQECSWVRVSKAESSKKGDCFVNKKQQQGQDKFSLYAKRSPLDFLPWCTEPTSGPKAMLPSAFSSQTWHRWMLSSPLLAEVLGCRKITSSEPSNIQSPEHKLHQAGYSSLREPGVRLEMTQSYEQGPSTEGHQPANRELMLSSLGKTETCHAQG